ncbi:MAG: hypothetical protein IH623_27265 [Verrucomicrobia bacterium]|nr:hypothetical protein [Verrucomicrobiota bacterium]
MKTWSRKKRWLLGLAVSLGLLLLTVVGAFLVIGHFNLFGAHQHCSKGLGLLLRQYASNHDGNYPVHTNGFGDALLLLITEDDHANLRHLVAPGDDGKMLLECLEKNLDVPEEKCSRIYIQGLSETNGDDGVALVFDAYPTPGGDHFRRPWGKPIRDVVMASGSVEFIPEMRWPAFAQDQIERLVRLGRERRELEKLFGVNSSADSKK